MGGLGAEGERSGAECTCGLIWTGFKASAVQVEWLCGNAYCEKMIALELWSFLRISMRAETTALLLADGAKSASLIRWRMLSRPNLRAVEDDEDDKEDKGVTILPLVEILMTFLMGSRHI